MSSASPPSSEPPPITPQVGASNRAFVVALATIGGAYVLFIALLLIADVAFVAERTMRGDDGNANGSKLLSRENPLLAALADPQIQYSIVLTLASATLSAIGSLIVAIPLGYVLARWRFPLQRVVETLIDIPIVLPPLVIGLSLLILFQFPPFAYLSRWVVYQIPAVILAQFSVACAFAVRSLQGTFDRIDPRCEQVARSLGCSRAQAFGWVVLPDAGRGVLAAFTLAWSRSLSEFGPVLVFAGATRMKTEVLATSVFLELNVGRLEGAVAVSLLMVLAATIVLLATRTLFDRQVSR
jgi:molybdate transport system permease protein